MKCKYCKEKISIIDSLLHRELVCKYCSVAYAVLSYNKQMDKFYKKVEERYKYFEEV